MTTNGFIVIRRLELAGEAAQEVTVCIKPPSQVGNDYRCEFQIAGLGDERARHAMGIDGAQALMLALQLIGANLYTSDASKQGRLTWLGSRNLGFPVPSSISDLIPPL
jgi:hypothetical protein